MNGEKILFFDPQKCIGCRICELFCSLEHYGVVNPKKTNIRIFRDHVKQIDIAHYCHQCSDTPCISACKFDALSKNPKTGSISVNEVKCTGCTLCIKACPYDAPAILPDKRKIIICDLCDGNPSCVQNCPENAIIYVDRDIANELIKNIKYEHSPKLLKTEGSV